MKSVALAAWSTTTSSTMTFVTRCSSFLLVAAAVAAAACATRVDSFGNPERNERIRRLSRDWLFPTMLSISMELLISPQRMLPERQSSNTMDM